MVLPIVKRDENVFGLSYPFSSIFPQLIIGLQDLKKSLQCMVQLDSKLCRSSERGLAEGHRCGTSTSSPEAVHPGRDGSWHHFSLAVLPFYVTFPHFLAQTSAPSSKRVWSFARRVSFVTPPVTAIHIFLHLCVPCAIYFRC